jgi:hypothetical protein
MLPIVQQKPIYPGGALQSGTEGWVRVQFTSLVSGPCATPKSSTPSRARSSTKRR